MAASKSCKANNHTGGASNKLTLDDNAVESMTQTKMDDLSEALNNNFDRMLEDKMNDFAKELQVETKDVIKFFEDSSNELFSRLNDCKPDA